MMLISCPFCGPRAHVEFTYERPVEAVVPAGAQEDEAIGLLYQRTNPRGVSRELWRHTHGCRAWLAVERDTFTHAVSAVAPWSGR